MSRPKRGAALKADDVIKLATGSKRPLTKTQATELTINRGKVPSVKEIFEETATATGRVKRGAALKARDVIKTVTNGGGKQTTTTNGAKLIELQKDTDEPSPQLSSIKRKAVTLDNSPPKRARSPKVPVVQNSSISPVRTKRVAASKAGNVIRNAIGLKSSNPIDSMITAKNKIPEIPMKKMAVSLSRPKRDATVKAEAFLKEVTAKRATIKNGSPPKSLLQNPFLCDGADTTSSPHKISRLTRATAAKKHIPIYRREIETVKEANETPPHMFVGGDSLFNPVDVYSIIDCSDEDFGPDEGVGSKNKSYRGKGKKKPPVAAIKKKEIARSKRMWTEKNVRKAKAATIKPHKREMKNDFLEFVTLVNPTKSGQLKQLLVPTVSQPSAIESPGIYPLSISPAAYEKCSLTKRASKAINVQEKTSTNSTTAIMHRIPSDCVSPAFEGPITHLVEHNDSVMPTFVDGDDNHFDDAMSLDPFEDSHDENRPPSRLTATSTPLPNNNYGVFEHRKPRLPLQSLALASQQSSAFHSLAKNVEPALRKIIMKKQLYNQNVELLMGGGGLPDLHDNHNTTNDGVNDADKHDVSDYFGFADDIESNGTAVKSTVATAAQSPHLSPKRRQTRQQHHHENLMVELKKLQTKIVPRPKKRQPKQPSFTTIMSSTLIERCGGLSSRQQTLYQLRSTKRQDPVPTHKKVNGSSSPKKVIDSPIFDELFNANELNNRREGDKVAADQVIFLKACEY